MRFVMEVTMDGAAFDDDAELLRIIARVAGHVADGETELGIYDTNGNRVGHWEVMA